MSAAHMEVVEEPAALRLHFPSDPSSRLQVDGRRLGSGGESRANLLVDVEGQTGAMTLVIKDGVVTLAKEGLFQNASVTVEPHPQFGGIFLVRLGPQMDLLFPGLNSEADVSLEGDAREIGDATPARPSTWGGIKIRYR